MLVIPHLKLYFTVEKVAVRAHLPSQMSNVTYVSALYNIYDRSGPSERLLKDVQVLLEQDLDLIIFVDEFYHKALSQLFRSSKVMVVLWDIAQSTIYNMIMANTEHLHLPDHRSEDKDTHAYMALMNSKIEFLRLAQAYTTSPYLAWIDAGSSKMISDVSSYQRLKTLHVKPGLGVVIPGCYQNPRAFEALFNDVWWNYLGTFFICEQVVVGKFYQYSIQALVRFFSKARLAWEVNVWIDICQKYPEIFT